MTNASNIAVKSDPGSAQTGSGGHTDRYLPSRQSNPTRSIWGVELFTALDMPELIEIWQKITLGDEKSWILFVYRTCVILMAPEHDLVQQAIDLMKEWGGRFMLDRLPGTSTSSSLWRLRGEP